MDYKVEYIGGDEAIVTFEGSIHIDCRNNLDRDFKDALDILINKYAI